MYVLALATDYDGTIAHHGLVDESTIEALSRFKASGRRLVLVTGRDLSDLRRVFADLDLFDRIVAENGALLYDPTADAEQVLTPAPPQLFIERLRQRGVSPLSVGRSIVATWHPNETTVLEVIQELGLELQIIFNKGAVMVLPSGMNKAVGLAAALRDLELSPHNVIGVGDAENDHAFLRFCGGAAAVANALPMVKAAADIRLAKDHGAGVIELVDRICTVDARILPPGRLGIVLGHDRDDREVCLEPHRGSVLIGGTSGIGKSTLAIALTEQMTKKKFEFCVFDPEGDYDQLENAISVGDPKTPPRSDEAVKLLRQLEANVVVNTQHLAVAERPEFFAKLFAQIASMRASTGRPHWLLIDEAHHLLPVSRGDIAELLPEEVPAAILITVHPEAVLPQALKDVAVVVALGDRAPEVIAAFCMAAGVDPPRLEDTVAAAEDEILVWVRSNGRAPRWVKPVRPRQQHKRHIRKYAEGDLGTDRSFFFRGPDHVLNLRAQNLMLFQQIAQGVDDRTWEHHLRAGDYSSWFRQQIKDNELADEAADVERDEALDAAESRRRIGKAIARRYTLPARDDREPK
jgi:HAD superfamily hydrolase (TIGR01484 family)